MVGSFLLALGVAIFVINDLALFEVNLMPGGHNELYAVGAILVASSSTWWFGLFDRPPGRW